MVLYNNIGLIAGNYEQYKQWRRQGLNWGQKSFYVLDASDLRGRSRDILILVLGTGFEKHELIDEAKRHGFEVRYYEV